MAKRNRFIRIIRLIFNLLMLIKGLIRKSKKKKLKAENKDLVEGSDEEALSEKIKDCLNSD